MAKNFLNEIRPVSRENRHERIESDQLPESPRSVKLPPRFKEKNFSGHNPRRGSRKIWTVAVLILIAGVFVATNYFASAKVNIVPKSEEINLDKTAMNATLSGDDKTLSFKIVKITGSAEKIVTGGTPTTVLTKATGKVIIYNNYSSAPQKLAIDTRLATSEGKIYKTDVALTVPGTKTEGGKVVPGSIEVGVHADQAGPDYNIPLSDFTIVGFKGTSKYDKFYARSKTVMSGGASGQGIALSEADSKVAHEAALSMLREKLISEAKASLPESSVLLQGSYVIHEDPDSGQTVAGKNVMIAKGSMYGILFNEEEITRKIAESSVQDYDGAGVTIPKISSLSVELKNKETITDTTSSVTFTLSGKANVVWEIPKTEVLNSLIGLKKRNLTTNLAQFPSIESVSVNMFPPWSLKLPKKEKSIEIVVVDQS